MSDEAVLLCSDRDGVRTLTLNRPRRKNAINRELWIALAEALTAAGKDIGVRAVVITGAEGAFCSGVDISTPDDSGLCSLLELTRSGQQPIELPGGETRTFLQDGDMIGLVGRAVAEGYASIGFGPCQGVIAPAIQP